MKTTYLLFAVLLFSVQSCTKNDKDDSSQAQITADINGVPWEAATTNSVMRKLTPAGNPPHTQISISGYAEGNTSTMTLIITDYKDKAQGDCVRLATFLPPGSATDTTLWQGIPIKSDANLSYNANSKTYATIYDGQITITACDGAAKTLSGTFEFVGTTNAGDTVRVTNGKIKGLTFIL